jgi:hypothetical protein
MPNLTESTVLTFPNQGVEGRHEPLRRAAIAQPLKKVAMHTPLCMSFHGLHLWESNAPHCRLVHGKFQRSPRWESWEQIKLWEASHQEDVECTE